MQKLYSSITPGGYLLLLFMVLIQACSSNTSIDSATSAVPDQEDSTELAPMQSLDSDSVSYNPYEAVPQDEETED